MNSAFLANDVAQPKPVGRWRAPLVSLAFFLIGVEISVVAMHLLYKNWMFVSLYLAFKGLI